MRSEIVVNLLEINRRFYTGFGDAFAATRRRLQPGVRRVLTRISPGGHWLDLGCGGGVLGLAWMKQFTSGSYIGLDASPVLLAHARELVEGAFPSGLTVRYAQADLADPDWVHQAPALPLDGVLAFAVLHHLPSLDLRRRVLRQVHGLLPAGSTFIHSEWQFQHSPRLLQRVQPWRLVGLDEADLEPGDTLLDWRFQLPGGGDASGLRYVHLFDREELQKLAEETGYAIVDEFESDGENGRLALYQTWQAH
ncbi:MAG: class I SAM-dependent methyltransferase [Anaerolineae bacterium]|nr:class I SAM-dependent methyltransferase [Anaerolineae bacterium]